MNTFREILRDHSRYAGHILKLAKSDLVRTYRGASLGWAWAVIRPTITILIYYVTFSIGLRHGKPIGDYSYFLWLISGFVPWFYISNTFTGGAGSIRKYSYLVKKVRYPVSTIPTIVSLSNFVVNLFLTAIVLAIFLIAGHKPDIYWAQLPFYALLMFLFFTTWSLFAGMLSVISKDFMNLVKSVTTALFWLSGVMYDVLRVKNAILLSFLRYNPVTYVVYGYRNSLVYKIWFWEDPRYLLNIGIVYAVLLALALWVYRRTIRSISDIL
jgi:teichoic acid transport system permease protein